MVADLGVAVFLPLLDIVGSEEADKGSVFTDKFFRVEETGEVVGDFNYTIDKKLR